jgi:predicted transcriptional regulator of viral defense system
MRMNLLLKKLYLEKKEFTTSNELKNHCKKLGISYENTIRNLIARGYLIRIFKGIFYVRTLQEKELGTTTYSYYELIAKGLELKNITHWYFGLFTALKLNSMTHEEFTIDHVINDTIFRAHPITIAGHRVKFHTIASRLLTFGIIKKGTFSYSDPEKTILDFLYLWRYNGVPRERILMDLSDYTTHLSKTKIKRYIPSYPNTIASLVDDLL